jgi:hypothetical protein
MQQPPYLLYALLVVVVIWFCRRLNKTEVKEHYLLKDGQTAFADSLGLRQRGPWLVNSTGQRTLDPRLLPVGGPGYGGPMTLRAGNFVPTADYRYMRRLQRASRNSPLAWSLLQQDYYPQYPGLSNVRLY